MADSFYVPLGDGRWQATVHTTGPWDARAQHGGPPSALLGRAMQRCQPREDMMTARFTCEILRPIPVGELTVHARLARPGRSVELLEATMTADGREVARATAWRVRKTADACVPSRLPAPAGLPDKPPAPPPVSWGDGYLSAIEWRGVRGSFSAPGPAAVWGRLRYPLVPDEEPGPLERVLAIADSGNGASWELDITRWHFINPELTCTCTAKPRASGSAWTPRPPSPQAARDSQAPSSPTSTARWASAPSRSSSPPGHHRLAPNLPEK